MVMMIVQWPRVATFSIGGYGDYGEDGDADGDGDDGDCDDGDDGDGDCDDGDDDGDNVGGMTGMAVLSQTEGVGGEDNNGCGVSRTFFKTFSLRLFFTQLLWFYHFNLFMVPQRQGRGSTKEFDSEFVRV